MGKNKKINKMNKFVGDQSSKRYGDMIPKYMKKPKLQESGFFFGYKNIDYIGKPEDKDGHVLIVGGAGSGKSSCIAIPTLETWRGTIFAIDIKGELTEQWNKIHSPKRTFKVFDFTVDLSNKEEMKAFSGYDPFYFMRQSGEVNLVQNAREISHAIIPLPLNISDPFWIQSARHVLTAVLLYGYSIGASFNSTMTRIQSTPIWDLIEEINNSDNLTAKMHLSQFNQIEDPTNNKMLIGIGAELSSKVIVFTTDLRIKNIFSNIKNSIKWEDLENQNIFMRISEDKLGQWDGVLTMMLTQLIRTMERRPEKYSSNSKKLPPVLLLLDEFPRLGKVEVIDNAIATLRSKNVTICLMVQSLAQLDKIYGKESRKIILDNCQYKAILQVSDPEEQKFFSEMAGSINTSVKSVSEGKSESVNKEDDKENINSIIKNNSLSVSELRQPTIYPHEFANLGKELVLMIPKGFCRINKAPYYKSNKDEGNDKIVI